jgi:hypothetical protein
MPLTSVTLSQSPLGLLWHPSGYSHTSIGNIPLLVELHNSKSKHKDVSRQSRYYLSFLQDNHLLWTLSLILGIMKMSSSLAASSVSAIGVTLAIAFILLVSNFTIINVQQQLTTHPGQLFIIPQTDESTPLSESEEKVQY